MLTKLNNMLFYKKTAFYSLLLPFCQEIKLFLCSWCNIQPVIRLSVPNILSVRKAGEGGDAAASLTDGNAADGKTDSSESLIADRMGR
ncbi:MAG: hypothetical protein HFH35_11625 [Eubacterium sp.]|nr:hypothetical protein [Eubacterium sp.]